MEGNPKPLKVPISDESLLTNKEKIILLRSSKIHGCVFPPWKAAPSQEEFIETYVDPTEYRLSEEQYNVLEKWKRPPSNAFNLLDWDPISVDLVQDITTDCSVVASLCAENARRRKLAKSQSLFEKSIYPHNQIPSNGKYIFKLHFNGIFRKVIIDDQLPYSRAEARILHVVDRDNPTNLLPALIEKAYLKVRGGYDFPGSNPGTDLWILTGWIPEQLFLQSEDVVPSAFWKRIFNAFNYGDILITLGTDRLSIEEEEVMGLASGHAYAIIDMKEQDERQLFLVKNPWSKGGTWNGYIDPSNPSARTQPEQSDGLAPGTFWMDLYNVVQYFQTIYLNWNPGLFRFRRDAHFTWNLSAFHPSTSLIKHPQYLLSSQKGGTVYLVLTRHFSDNDVALPSEDLRDATLGYLGLCAFESTKRLVINRKALHQSNYIDAPNILLRFELLPGQPYVIIVSEQDLPHQETNFTLSAFSVNAITVFCPASEKYDHTKSIQGAWTKESAKGNVSCEGYEQNPQYSLNITEPSDVSILIESNNPDIAVHTKLLWSGGNRVQLPLTAKDVYGDSGEYTRGCALAEISNVLAGTYTIACSTFKPDQTARFTLHISSTHPKLILKPIANVDAGLLVQHLHTATFRPEIDRLLAPIEALRNTRLRFTLEHKSTSSPSPVKISIEFGQGPNKNTLLSSGDFADKPQLRIGDIDISQRTSSRNGPGVWLVVERAGGSYVPGNEEVQVDVLSDGPGVMVGAWGRASDVPIEELRGEFEGISVRRI